MKKPRRAIDYAPGKALRIGGFRMWTAMRRGSLFPLVALMLLGLPGVAFADGKPASSESMIIGPYAVVVSFSQNPPQVETPLEVTVVPQDHLRLSGQLIAQPGLGTDATELHTELVPDKQQPTTLVGVIHLPVRGAWRLVINLNGPRGPGSAGINVTVSAPGAVPPWLGWLIGLSPLVGCAWFAWQQRNYRKRLLRREEGE